MSNEWEQRGPWDALDLPRQAGEDEIRAAYLDKIKQHPPDRDPEVFERIRDAYEILRDPRRRARLILDVDPAPTVESLLDEAAPARRRVGPALWIAAIAAAHTSGSET